MINRFSLFLGGLGLFALQGCKTQQGEQAQLPNVIYVFPDQYRNQAMEFWGQDGFRDKVNFRNDPVHTPNLNSLAREALVLSSAQRNCPLSSPHRGMLLTGMYPNKSGIPLNCNSNRPISSLRADVDCIGDVFNKSGYDCAYFGKLHADFPTPNDPQRPGHYVEDRIPAWDAYTPKERRHGFNYWYSYGTFDEHKNPRYWDTDGNRHDPKEWSPLHESKMVVSYLKNEGNVRDPKKPFFIMVGMNPPHSPYRSLNDCEEQDFNLYKDQPLDSLLIRPNVDLKMKKAESARYYFASVTGVDRAFGQILTTLKELGLDKNTLVILSSDNGPVVDDGYKDQAVELLGDHTPGGIYRGGKYSSFEAGTRIPCIWSWQGVIRPGTVSDALLCQIDWFATFAEMLNVRLPEGAAPDSEPMLKAWTGKQKKGREWLVLQNAQNNLSVTDGRWKYLRPGNGPAYLKAVNIELGNSKEPQLYDLKKDPKEKNNVAGQNPELVKKMAAQLEKIVDGRYGLPL